MALHNHYHRDRAHQYRLCDPPLIKRLVHMSVGALEF